MIYRALLLSLLLASSAWAQVFPTPGPGGRFTTGGPAPTFVARFIAYPITQGICPAPCHFYFDAIGQNWLSVSQYNSQQTTDLIYGSKIRHTHRFIWDFGDRSGSDGTLWSNTGLSKNSAMGPWAAHTYGKPGSYNVSLLSVNPAGIISTYSTTVVVADPDAYYSAANTYCLRATADGDWNGCVLDCAAGNQRCVTWNDFDQFINQSTNCVNTTEDCPNADSAKARIQVRRGDAFTSSTTLNLTSAAGNGIIEAFGTGADPLITFSAGQLNPGDNWTFDGLSWSAASGTYGMIEHFGHVHGVLHHRSQMTATGGNSGVLAFVNAEGAGGDPTPYTWPYLNAVIDTNVDGYSGNVDGIMIWTSGRFLTFQGGSYDKHATGAANTYYSSRSIGSQNILIQHTRWEGIHSDPIQLRADDSHNTFYGSTGLPPDERLVNNSDGLISDNLFDFPNVPPAGSATYGIRICVDSGCHCGDGALTSLPSGCAGQGGSGHVVDAQNFIIERNSFRYNTGAAGGNKYAAIGLFGSNHTVRDNLVSYRTSLPLATDSGFVLTYGDPLSHSGTASEGNIDVVGNSIVSLTSGYTGDYFTTRSFASAYATGCLTNCRDRNNLTSFLGALGGGGSIGNTVGFTQATNYNVANATDPFVGTYPATGWTEGLPSVVPLSTETSTILNQGTALTDSDLFDGMSFTRPASTGWDIGAIERGATLQSATGGEEFFVSPGGSNGNPCSYALPCQTLAHVLPGAGPGDVIWMLAGTYAENITSAISFGGGPDWEHSLLIAGYRGDAVVLQPTSGDRAIYLEDTPNSWIEFRDFTVDAVNVNAEAVKITNNGGGGGSGHIRFRNMEIMNAPAHGILTTGIATGDGIEIIGCDIHDNGTVANLDHGIYFTTNNGLIEDNEIHANAANGIEALNGTEGVDVVNITIRRNKVYGNGTAGSSGEGIQVGGANIDVYLNEVYSNTTGAGLSVYQNNPPPPPPERYEVFSTDTRLQYNWVYGNNGGGAQIEQIGSPTGVVDTPNVLAAP